MVNVTVPGNEKKKTIGDLFAGAKKLLTNHPEISPLTSQRLLIFISTRFFWSGVVDWFQ